MAKFGPNALKGVLIVTIMATLFFSMLPSLLYTMSTGIDDTLEAIQLNTTLYGTGPAGIAGTVQANWGYFIVVGVLLLVIGVVSGVFKKR